MTLQSYKDLRVWQVSRLLVKDVYAVCGELPKDEVFGLCSQMKRAAVSIPSNIAEGYLRNNRKEYIQFLGISAGSAGELETQLILANDLFNCDTGGLLVRANDLQKMLAALIKHLKN